MIRWTPNKVMKNPVCRLKSYGAITTAVYVFQVMRFLLDLFASIVLQTATLSGEKRHSAVGAKRQLICSPENERHTKYSKQCEEYDLFPRTFIIASSVFYFHKNVRTSEKLADRGRALGSRETTAFWGTGGGGGSLVFTLFVLEQVSKVGSGLRQGNNGPLDSN